MANSLTVFDQTFSSQKEAEFFFYQIRDASGQQLVLGWPLTTGKKPSFRPVRRLKPSQLGLLDSCMIAQRLWAE